VDLASTLILALAGMLALLAFGFLGVLSLGESERRASIIAFVAAVLFSTPIFILAAMGWTVKVITIAALVGVSMILLLLFLLPVGKSYTPNGTPNSRFDERDIIFSRFRLKQGSEEYESYYHMHPENKDIDDLTRTKPGLNNPGSLFWNPFLAASVDASFTLTEAMNKAVDGQPSGDIYSLPPTRMTAYIKNLAKYYGALHVGVTELKPYHVYSHVGRGPGQYGSPISLEHRYAIAFSVEMDYDMIGPNPCLQGSMESAREYVEVGRVAVQLAAAIRLLGYPARGHMDGNYRVICPLVARDAGLGVIGRMGLLMTPDYGPRVRLGVVTTDLELVADKPIDGTAVIDFCTICKKCAQNCPSQSIPFGDRQVIDGALRWRIDSDSCYRYWTISGTDCGRCMAVCPYSHPNTVMHNFIRWGIARSGLFRRTALHLDDLFYGRKPTRRPAPEWTQIQYQKKHLQRP
jgi:ferredoxin